MSSQGTLFGMSAEFSDPHDLLDAAQKAKEAGYSDMKVYSPFAVHGIDEIVGNDSTAMNWTLVIAMAVGVLGAFLLQWWTTEVHYAINVAGRPITNYGSWPAWTLIMFEAAILFGALSLVGYLFISTNLPTPYHPIFNAPNAENISTDAFVLCILVTDKKFHMRETREFLLGLEPTRVSEVAS
ncbi:MAG: DUF3341 domain-containing protein [Chloroflexota bacterium]